MNLQDDCVVWSGYIAENGYGRTTRNNRPIGAHRVAYEGAKGPIPPGLVIDHLCRNRACVNPAHLEAVTTAENIRRGRSAQREKSHCPTGHPYDADNTIWKRDGSRHCRLCQRALKPKQRQNLRAKHPDPETDETVPHGSQNGYLNYACRCAACREAHRMAVRKSA